MKSHFNPRWNFCLLILAAMIFSSPAHAQTSRPATPIITLRGDANAIGNAYGKSLGESIRTLDATYFSRAMTPAIHTQMSAAAMLFEPTLRPEHLAEIKALAASSKLDEAEIMLANSFLDLSPMNACSSISVPADASPDHVARLARNLDFPSFGIADKYSIVIVYHPTDRYAFVTVGWPGLIGALSGMNEHGLTLVNMEVSRQAGRAPRAMPYTLLYRTVLERCKTIEEAIDLLKGTPRQTPNNLMLMDAAGNRAVVELTTDAVTVRLGKPDAALISTNHQRGQDSESPGRCRRYDYLHEHAMQNFGKLDSTQLQAMLAKVEQGEMTLQSMIFEPANRVMYLATGASAPEHEMEKIDLKEYLR